MKTRLILIIALLTISSRLISQELFQAGYYVNEDNSRVECLIKNEGWVDNPTEFIYKLNPDDQPTKGKIDEIKEFSVGDAKFIRKTVDIDYSSNKNEKLSIRKDPEFKSETVYLRYLVEGEASLLTFKNSDLRRFFLGMRKEEPAALVYKKYKSIDGSGTTLENTSFRRHLMQNVVCGEITIERLTAIRYIKNDLQKIVSEYNTCKGSENVVYKGQESKKIKARIALRPGVRIVNFETTRSSLGSPTDAKFDAAISFRFGVEFEFVLPGNNQKWAILLEPTYQKYESTSPREPEWSVTFTEGNVEYTSFELALGLRYYSILSKDSRLFFNGLVILDKPSKESFVQTSNTFTINSGMNAAIGVGYKYSDRYFAEVRYGLKRDVLVDWAIENNFNYISFVLGVNIL